ncbi:unnamed protein product, partial [Rotaria sp. Silwood1]
NNLLFIKRNMQTLKKIYSPLIEQDEKRKINLTLTKQQKQTTELSC